MPLTTTTKNPDELLPPPSGGAQTVSGTQSSPGWCVPPAEAGSVNSPTSTQEASNLFIVSPQEVVKGHDGFTVRTVHSNTVDPDLVLFRTLADHQEFDRLIGLCRERFHSASEPKGFLRWRKDEAIAEAMRGNYRAALELLTSVNWLAEQVEGSLRGRYENELGLVLVEYGRPAMGLDHFRCSFNHHLIDGSLKGCAEVEHNIGRAYAAQGEHGKAAPYFERALTFARESNNYGLEMEICQSLMEFGGVE